MIEHETSCEMLSSPFDRSAAWIIARRPALETVARPFAAVLNRRAAIIDALHERLPATLFQQPVAFGVSRLIRHPRINWDACMTAVIGALIPSLADAFPQLKPEFRSVAAMVDQHPRMAEDLSRAWLDDNEPAFNALAEETDLSAGVLGFVVYWANSALLNALRTQWQLVQEQVCTTAGQCPFCGRLPALAFLSRPDPAANECLSGGGGQKFLYCGLCGHQWRFARNRCPVCETNAPHHLAYYQETEQTGERIDACHQCGHYLLCMDWRRTDAPPALEMAAVGMVHLDVLAREKGFLPTAWTPWNRID